jgi:hypothetical protein
LIFKVAILIWAIYTVYWGMGRGVRGWRSHLILLYLWYSSCVPFTFLLGFIATFKFQLFSSDKGCLEGIHLRFLSCGVAISS